MTRRIGAVVAPSLLLLVVGSAAPPGDLPRAAVAEPTASVSSPPPKPSPQPAASSSLPAAAPRTPVPGRRPASTAPAIPVVDAAPRPTRVATSTVPVRLQVGSVDIDLPVIEVGVDDDGAMGLPDTVTEVGWYRFGPRPADRVGATVLAAHVDTRAEGLGPFVRLREVDPGDEIAVTDRAGRVSRYRITAVDRIPKSEVPLDQVFRRDGPPTLRVLTCGGTYDRRDGYRDNVLVTAEASS